MSDATVAPKDVLEAAKGKDVDIVLDMNGYKWTINGNNIQADNLKDINLATLMQYQMMLYRSLLAITQLSRFHLHIVEILDSRQVLHTI